MSIHSTFLFPKKDFKLVLMNRIGYISDNMFYQLDFQTGQTTVELNPHGRSYQAFTTNHKKGLVVLADYGKNPTLYFNYIHANKKDSSFQLRDICTLQIDYIALSGDCRYLAVCCGIPERRVLVVDVEQRRLLGGSDGFVDLGDRKVKKLAFNPANSKTFSIMFQHSLQAYNISQQFKPSASQSASQSLSQSQSQQESPQKSLQQHIKIQKKHQITSQTALQTFEWDQINNMYVSNGRYVFVYSTDTEKEVVNYELEGDFDGSAEVVSGFLLTQRHLIIVYVSGRVEWILKYYPDLMQQQQISKKPFYLQRYYQFTRPINHALYNHFMTKIIIAHKNGMFSILPKPAQSNQNQQQDEDNKGANQSKSDKSKKLEIEVTTIGEYHANQLVFCREVRDRAVFMTVSRAGKVIFWDIREKKSVAFMEIGFEIISADVNNNFTLLSVANKSGIIRFYSLEDFLNIFLVKEFRLVEKGQINQVAFSSNSNQLACLSIENKRVFYVLTVDNAQIQILGYVNLPYTPVSICWNKTTKTLVKAKFQHLLVCVGFGIIMINGPEAKSVKLRAKHFQLNCDLYGLRTDTDQKILQVLPNGQILSTGSDKILKKYKQPEDPISKFNPEAKSAVLPPLEELQAHQLQTTFMKVHNKFFISGGADGTLQIRPIQNFNSVKTLKVNGWRKANLNTGSVSQIDGLFFACGKDGCLSMWKTKDLQIKYSSKLKKQKSKFNKMKSAGDSLKYFEVAIQDQYMQKMKETILKKKKDQLDKINKIKSELKQLLAQNETHADLQKLTRDEFVIDLQLRDKINKIGLQNCQKIKKQSNKKVLYNQVYRNKLKQITWDQMQQHLRAINGLKNSYIVYNYQIRKIPYQQRRRLQLIIDLRRNQIREMKKRGKQIVDIQFFKNKNVINGGITQPLILTPIEKKQDKKQEKTKKKKQQEAVDKQPQETEEIPKQEIWQLLYSSFQLYSDNAKRNQIIIMQNIIVKIKQTFNKQFNKLLKLRQSQNQMINDKNKRIIQICEELKRKNQVIVTNKNILQNPDKILQVNNKQIPFSRYLSRQQKQKLQKERLRQQQRLKALAQDDASQRALQKMMGGTLQEKKTSVLQVTVQRQKWMDKPIEQMTEEQKNKLKQYEQKKQKAQQQKQRIVKKLQAQLRKLKAEIDDLMQKYDQKLFTLLRRRIQYDLRIQQQQLYCIKLALSMVNYKQQSEKYSQLKKKQNVFQQRLKVLQTQVAELRLHQEQIQRIKEHKKILLDNKKLAEQETKVKTIQKSVFEEYHSNIKKRKELQAKLLQNDQIARYQIIPLDPMRQIQSKNLSNQNAQIFKFFQPQIKTMQQTYDFSDALITNLENRFNIRKQQLELERKLKGVKDSIKKLQENIQNQNRNKQQELREIQNIQKDLKQSKSDLQIQFRIKKGLVQIDSETPVPRLNDALLISKSEIDSKNANIIEKAQLKIQVMKEIKTCKITVTEQTLQLQRKQALIDQLSTMIKQVQMLKVKKQMQTALAKKDTKINQNELRSLKQQIQKVRKEGQKRISLFQKKIQKVSQQIEAIKKQNKQLQVQRWNLDNTVKQRQKIKDMMVGQKGQGNQQAAQKFDQISVNRKLFDKAKQQTDQIELLRQQLSKLKAKTFANFSSVQR